MSAALRQANESSGWSFSSPGARRVSLARTTALSLAFLVCFVSSARADRPAPLSAQTLKAPSGASSLKGLGESFSASPTTGTGSYSIPIVLPPGLATPAVSLNYSGGSGNGEVGVGFSLPVLQVYRTTDKGSPHFDESDRFAVRGPEYNDELVLADASQGLYRLKNEGGFLLFRRDAANDRWTISFPNGGQASLGDSVAARAQAAGKSTRWFVETTTDVNGHLVRYRYWKDAAKVYWKGVDYQQEASAAYRNQVEFVYETRPDVLRDYRYGDEELTRFRLAAIQVIQGARTLRQYAFSYRPDAIWSLLVGVQLNGENGLSLPTLTLGRLEPSPRSGRFVTTEGYPTLSGVSSGRMTLEDVNGDGLPDLLNGTASNYEYYENLDGVRFANTPVSLGASGSADRNLEDTGVVLTDVDGDGYRDVLEPGVSGQLRYFPGGNIQAGRFLGFGAFKSLNPNALVSDVTRADFRLVDLNSDGRTDLLQQRTGIGDIWIENDGAQQFLQRTMPSLPSGVQFSDRNLELSDFNGDGVLDLVQKEFDQGKHDLLVWYGVGAGRFWSSVSVWNAPVAAAREILLSDVNHDGQTDLIRVSGSWVAYYLNDGSGNFAVEGGSFHGMPETSRTKKVVMADMNGNGTADLVWFTVDSKMSYLDLMEQPYVGLLSHIDNGMGMVVDIAYRSSTDYMVAAKLANARWSTTLPHPVAVISEVSTRDSFEMLNAEPWESRTSYDYRDGYFDAKEREFRGFARVTVTDWGDDWQETRITELNSHVGRNLTTLADEETLKGKIWLQVVKSGDGSILSSDETNWQQRWLCREDLGAGAAPVLPVCSGIADKSASKDSMVALGVSLGNLQGTWERQLSARYTASQTDYDEWGQAKRASSYGEVSIPGGHTLGQPWAFSDLVTGIGDDESVQEFDRIYRVDPSNGVWLIGFPSGQRTKSVAGTVLSSSRVYYDGPAFTGLALGQIGKGLVTRREAWLGEEGRWVPLERTGFNADGLPEQQLDATGGKSVLEYDPETHLYPIKERRSIAANSELAFSADYDRGYGVMTSLTDANAETTRYRYDGLGRLTTVIDSKGSEAEPLVSYFYAYGTPESPISVTTTRRLVTRGQGVYRDVYDFTDGLGRSRLHKVQAEQGYVASGFQTLSSHGEATRSFKEFRSSNAGFEPAPPTVPHTEVYRDALGRVLREQLPVTPQQGVSFVQRQYLPFETRRFDERDSTEGSFTYPTITRFDGLRRIREVEKKNQQGANVVTLKWALTYDARGSIKTFKDPKAYTRSYAYDGLSRLLTIADPNLGAVGFGYDDAGRTTKRVDALGQEQRIEYDIAGRVSHEQMLAPNAGGTLSVTSEYAYHYDAPAPSGPLNAPTHLVGRVSWMEYPTGTEYFSYDERGQNDRSAVTLWDGVSSFAAQHRDTFQRSATFDATGEQTSATLPGNFSTSTSYNLRGLVERLTVGMSGTTRDVIANAVYDERGSLTSVDRGNGTRSCRRYDERGAQTAVLLGKQAEVSCGPENFANTSLGLYHVDYQWSYDGLISGLRDSSGTNARAPRLDATYHYDRLRQLTSARSGGVDYGYDYDEVQNLTATHTQKAGQTVVDEARSYGSNAGPNALTQVGNTALSYDADGQLKRYNGFDLQFDVEGQLVKASKPGGKRIDYHYDSSGTRKLLIVTEGSTKRVYRYPFPEYEERQAEKVYRVQSSGVSVEYHSAPGLAIDATLLDELTSYVNTPSGKPKPLPQEWLDLDGDGDGFDAGDLAEAQQAFWQGRLAGGPRGDYRYVETDHLGSSVLATDSSGADVSARRYTPYGNLVQRGGVQPSVGFASAEVEPDDDLGLVHMGGRYYAPALARWVTPDRFIGDSNDLNAQRPLESNLYSYAANNPVSFADPSGGIAQWVAGVIIGAAFDVAIQAIDIALDDKKTAKDFSFGSVLVSGAMGGVGVGLASKLGKLATLVTNPAVQKLAVVALNGVADAATSMVSNFAKKALFNVGDGVTVKGTLSDVVGSFIGSKAIKWIGSKLAGARTLRAAVEAANFGSEAAAKAIETVQHGPELGLAFDKHMSELKDRAAANEALRAHMENFGLAGSGFGQAAVTAGQSVWNWAKRQASPPAPGAGGRDELSKPAAAPSVSVTIPF